MTIDPNDLTVGEIERMHAQIATLTDEKADAIGDMVRAKNDLDRANAEIKRLRDLAELAPHGGGCSVYLDTNHPCDCWKRLVAPAQERGDDA